MAFVAPQRPNIQIGDVSFNPFCDALELYARTRGKEKRDEESYGMLLRMAAEAGVNLPEETESETDAPPDVMCHGNSCPVEQPENASEPDKAATLNLDGFEPVPLRAHNTHTHTAGANDGGGGQPVAFAGKGSGEKREILEHMQRFVDTYSGARRRIAKEANGALTYEELLAMSEKKPLPLAKWRIAEEAMRRIEGQDQ